MALVACKECKAQVSTKAEACPQCGAKVKRSSWGWPALGILAVLGVIGSAMSPSPSSTSPAPGAASPSVAPSPDVKQSTAGVPAQRQPGKAVAAMAKSYDDVEKITWYRDRSSPDGVWRTGVYLYIGDKNDRAWLRLKAQYAAENWLFVRRALFVIDGDKAGMLTGSWQRDNSSSIFEWLDVEMSAEQMHLLRQLLVAKAVTVRFEGDKYFKDYKLTAAELKALKSVVAAYKELGGSTY